MKKIIKTGIIAAAAVIALIPTVSFIADKKMKARKVTDYEQRINIWEEAAGNNSHSKLDDMNINFKANNTWWAMTKFVKAIVNKNYSDEEQTIDTFTYLYEIKGGYEKETYEDEPYLIPYTIENPKGAVLVIPGGGYGYKSLDGETVEGKDIAMELNKYGYSAFALHYRSNPYEYPIPQLDVQRAVRYLRANASSYGFDSEDIALIGFSAGGNQVGTFINIIMGGNYFPEDYTPDKIDQTDDHVFAAGMIYPALCYDENIPMLFASFDSDIIRDETKRQELLHQTNLAENFSSKEIPQLVAYGTKDSIVGMDGAKAYIKTASDAGAKIVEVKAEGQDHGFKPKFYMEQFIELLDEEIK